MKQRDTLARLTLDTLPINIAVLDEDGTILLTNQAWDEFAGAGPREADMVGVNYFGATDTSADEYAGEALEGLRTVIDGEQDLFTLEYPCHSPDEKRWFLMRATRLPENEQGSVVVAHIDITERKLAELRASERNRELEHLTARLSGLVSDVLEAVLQADTREAIESTVCARLAEVDPYVAAWVGRSDLRTDRVAPSASAGFDAAAAEPLSLDATDDPTVAAIQGDDPVVRSNPDADELAPVHRGAFGDQTGSLVAFPLVYNQTRYGALTVYAAEPEALDERELAVLEVLARATATAINAVEGRRILSTDTVVELELSLTDEGLFYRDLASELDAEFTYEGTVTDEGRGMRMLFVVTGADPADIESAANSHEGITEVALLSSDGDHSVVEFGVTEPPVVAALADHGAETTAIEARGREAKLTVELPARTDTRAVLEQLSETYPSVDLLARRERERTEQTRAELVADIEERLTERQRHSLQKAYLGGFFDWPRDTSGEDLAESMDISPSTYHQHLRTAERKVLSALFED
ncbi:bacterio-opsin activator domain-containing protein [Halobacteriales archaeon Cl-PHB]